MNNSAVADPNPRVVIGNNEPPTDLRTTLEEQVRELLATASGAINASPAIQSDEQSATEGEIKKKITALEKKIEAARKDEQKPHDEAIAAIRTFWKGLTSKLDTTSDAITPRLSAWLAEKKRRKEAAEAKAREEAEAARIAAEKAADAAYEAWEKQQTGEAGAEGINTLAAVEAAKQAKLDAEKAERAANRIARQTVTAGPQGTKGVYLRTKREIVLKLPTDAPRMIRALAIYELIELLHKHQRSTDLLEELNRLLTGIYVKTKEVPPHCELVETEIAT